MEYESPSIDDVEELADLWVELAREQRDLGSRLLSEENRSSVRDTLARLVVTGGLIVARAPGEGDDEGAAEGDDDRIVGFVMFEYAAGSYETDAVRGTIQNLYVRPEYRNEGIGAELLGRAEGELVDAGTDVVAVEAMAENEDALRFYRAHDYDVHRLRLEKRLEDENHSKDDG